MQHLPDQIKVTFTADHLAKAGDYGSNTNCVLCTALKELGYVPNVGGCGETTIHQGYPFTGRILANYKAESWFFAGAILRDDMSYNPALIGRTLTLTKV